MRRILFAAAAACWFGAIPSPARAQGVGAVTNYAGPGTYYGAPGFYGTSYGTASYGMARTYSEFSSPYGAGFAYGYPPSGFAGGKYGVGLWRPGFATTGYVYGSSYSYRTFPASTWPVPSGIGPPFGVYAPGFGPPAVTTP